MNFYATSLLHVLTLYSRKYFPISQPNRRHIFLTILFLKVLIMNQLIQSTFLIVHSIPTIQVTFPETLCFFNFNFLLCYTKITYHKGRTRDSKKMARGLERPTTKKTGPEALQLQETAGDS